MSPNKAGSCSGSLGVAIDNFLVDGERPPIFIDLVKKQRARRI